MPGRGSTDGPSSLDSHHYKLTVFFIGLSFILFCISIFLHFLSLFSVYLENKFMLHNVFYYCKVLKGNFADFLPYLKI